MNTPTEPDDHGDGDPGNTAPAEPETHRDLGDEREVEHEHEGGDE